MTECVHTHYVTQAANAEPYIRQLLEAKKRLVEGILKGAVMEPNITDIVVLAIQNPGDTEATIIRSALVTPNEVIAQYGEQIERGAFVALTGRDYHGNTTYVKVFVADRVGDTLYLQDNEHMSDDDAPSIDDIGAVVARGEAPLPTPPEPELETFTVFGNNDDNENFVAVIAATEETAQTVGVQAGLVDAGYEESVKITAILKGDQSHLERVSI